MRKLFLMAVMAFTALSALTFVSCSKDDDTPSKKDDPTPATKYDVKFMTCIAADQDQFVDMAYTINANGTEKTFNLSDMTLVTDSTKILNITTYTSTLSLYKSMASDRSVWLKAYIMDLGSSYSGTYALKKVTYTPKEGRPTDKNFDAVISYGLYTDPYSSITSNAAVHIGVKNDSIVDFCKTISEGEYSSSLNF